jgi:hypothetical protein
MGIRTMSMSFFTQLEIQADKLSSNTMAEYLATLSAGSESNYSLTL